MPCTLDDFEVKFTDMNARVARPCPIVWKIAVVRTRTSDSICSGKPHISTYPLVREEIRSISDTLSGPTPTDVSAVYKGKGKGKGKEKGKKGKGKGKAKDKDKEKDPAVNPDAEVVCYRCQRTLQARLQNHGEGQRQEECVNTVEQTPGPAAEANPGQKAAPTRICIIELDDWILVVNIDDHEAQLESIERVMVDWSCGFSVCARVRA